MADTSTIESTFYIIVVFLTAVPALYLLYGSIRFRLYHMMYMSITLMSYAITAVISYIVQVNVVIRALVSVLYPVFIVAFVQKAHHQGTKNRRRRRILFAAIAGFRVIQGIEVMILLPLFSIVTFLGWFSPEWFKRLLDKHYTTITSIIDRMDVKGIVEIDKILTHREIINIVDFISQHAANITARSPSAMKGMLMLSIQAQLGDDALYHLNYGNIKAVIDKTFKNRLQYAGINNPTHVAEQLDDFLTKNQANLMMLVM